MPPSDNPAANSATMLDMFAAHALAGIIAASNKHVGYAEESELISLAEESYIMARYMLAQLHIERELDAKR